MQQSNRPLKRFGQNFLNNPHYQQKIVDALGIGPDDHVIEIGPGKGALSEHIIAAHPAKYTAVEIDRRWAAHFAELFPGQAEILNKDFLEIDLAEMASQTGGRLKIIGNIPYNITSPILFRLIDYFEHIECAVMMTQKEVARRISSANNNKDYGILSVISQAYSDVSYLFEVKSGNFFPVPKVDSAVIRMDFFERINGLQNIDLFRQIVRQTFNYRRKMLRNSLGRIFEKSIVYSLDSAILDRRPENLTVREFKDLANVINEKSGHSNG